MTQVKDMEELQEFARVLRNLAAQTSQIGLKYERMPLTQLSDVVFQDKYYLPGVIAFLVSEPLSVDALVIVLSTVLIQAFDQGAAVGKTYAEIVGS